MSTRASSPNRRLLALSLSVIALFAAQTAAWAQQIMPAEQASLKPGGSKSTPEAFLIATGVSKAEVISIDASLLALGKTQSLVLPLKGEMRTMQLAPADVFATGAAVLAEQRDGSMLPLDVSDVRAFQGRVLTLPDSSVFLVTSSSGTYASVRYGDGTGVCVEPLAAYDAAASPDEHVMYQSSDVPTTALGCGVPDGEAEFQSLSLTTTSACGGTCMAQVACDVDSAYVARMGSVNAAVARVTWVIGRTNIQFEHDVSISHRITALVVRDLATDPYLGYPDVLLPGQINTLFDFSRDLWQTMLPAIPRDITFYFCGHGGFSVVGLGTPYMCQPPDNLPSHAVVVFGNGPSILDGDNYSCLVAHELGHCWAATHCNCPISTMYPSVNGANTFQDNPDAMHNSIAEITSFRDTRPCIDPLDLPTGPVPFSDTFASLTIDTSVWHAPVNASITTLALGEPNGSTSLTLRGGGELATRLLPTQDLSNLSFNYTVEPAGAAEPPEPGDDLVVEYLNVGGTWQQLARHTTTLPTTAFTSFNAALPANAYHLGTRLRFRNLGGEAAGDHWFIGSAALVLPALPPGASILSTPADNAQHIDLRPAFLWGEALNSTTFRLQVDDNADFSSPAINLVVAAITYTPPTNLLADTTYYWRVLTSNGGPTTSSTSIHSFHTISSAPGPLQLLLPDDNVTVPADEVWLSWTASANFYGGYLVQFSDTPAFTTLITSASTDGVQAIRPASIFPRGQRVYWRVLAVNGLGSATSNTRSFTMIAPRLPSAPRLTVPTEGTILYAEAPVFQWQSIPETNHFMFRYYDESNHQLFQTEVTGTSYTPQGLPYAIGIGRWYWWKVSGINSVGEGTQGISGYFQLVVSVPPTPPPGQITGYLPTDGTEFTTLNFPDMQFAWTPHVNAATYAIEISNTFAMSPIIMHIDNLPKPTVTISSADIEHAFELAGWIPYYNENVYWRVRAYSSAGQLLATSQIKRFVHHVYMYAPASPPPGPFSLIAPKEKETATRLLKTFVWSPSANATEYTIVIDNDRDFSSPELVQAHVTDTSYTVLLDSLNPTAPYYWMVIAQSGDAYAYSDIRLFRTCFFSICDRAP